jgi:hypothetical protein
MDIPVLAWIVLAGIAGFIAWRVILSNKAEKSKIDGLAGTAKQRSGVKSKSK